MDHRSILEDIREVGIKQQIQIRPGCRQLSGSLACQPVIDMAAETEGRDQAGVGWEGADRHLNPSIQQVGFGGVGQGK